MILRTMKGSASKILVDIEGITKALVISVEWLHHVYYLFSLYCYSKHFPKIKVTDSFQQTVTCSKSTTETLVNGEQYVQMFKVNKNEARTTYILKNFPSCKNH